MATYIMLMKFINPGVDSIKNAHVGRQQGKKAAKALGAFTENEADKLIKSLDVPSSG